jgi:hypothetical protein
MHARLARDAPPYCLKRDVTTRKSHVLPLPRHSSAGAAHGWPASLSVDLIWLVV